MATATYRIDFADIKRIVPMEKVIDFLGIAALRKRSATQWKGACPFCSGLDCFVVSNDGGVTRPARSTASNVRRAAIRSNWCRSRAAIPGATRRARSRRRKSFMRSF